MRIKPDPLGSPRDPLAVFLLCLAWFSGVGFIVGHPSSGSLEASLPHWGAMLWGVMLTLGASASLTGIFWQGQVRDGLLIKRVGMATLSISAVVYASVLWVRFGWPASVQGGLAFFFGYACYLRYRTINKAVRVLIVGKAMSDGEES